MNMRRLIELQTGNEWIGCLDDKALNIETVKNGKSRISKKEYETHIEAATQFEKKVWEQLKKGYVLTHAKSNIGEPILHYFVGSGYTGCQLVLDIDNVIVTNKNGDRNNAVKDNLVFISQDGALMDTIQLPRNLPWDISYVNSYNSIFIDLDHIIYKYDFHKREFQQLTGQCEEPASFILSSGDIVAYCTHPNIIVMDVKTDKVILSATIECEKYSGHSCQLTAALSEDGHILALCNKVGEIQLIDVPTGDIIYTITAKLGLVKKMKFASFDNILVALEQYESWGVRFFDLKKKEEIITPFVEGTLAARGGIIDTFCFNRKQDKFAVLNRKEIHIYDFRKKSLLHSFKAEHMVKTGEISFVGDKLGVRTDYGCLSLYEV